MTSPRQFLALALLAGCAGADESLAPGSLEAPAAARAGSGGLAAPSGLDATAVSSSRIDLSWEDNSGKETGFEVHVSIAGPTGPFATLATAGANVTAYFDGGLTPEAGRCYKVRAVQAATPKPRFSGFSNTACATTPSPPAIPPSPPAMSSFTWPMERPGAGIEVIWVDRASNETGFRIERSDYEQASWVVDGTVGADVTSYMADLPLCYRVVAFNAGGDSPPSIPGCTLPAAPTNLAVTMVDTETFEITWTDNSGVEDAYEVIYGMGGCQDSFDEFAIAQLPANSTSFRTGPAIGGCPHDYYLVAPLRMWWYGESGGVEAP